MSCIQEQPQKECVQMPRKMARSDPRPSVRVTRGAGSGQHLASVLQERRENANIDAGLGFIWRISVQEAKDNQERRLGGRQLAFKPNLQIIRRSRRPLLRGLEQARRSALAHHVPRIAPMGARVLINGTRYYTVVEAAAWFVLGALPAMALPFALRRLPIATAILDPFMVGGYAAPKLALAPLFILWFGIGIESKIVLVAVTVFFIVYFSAQAGIRALDAG